MEGISSIWGWGGLHKVGIFYLRLEGAVGDHQAESYSNVIQHKRNTILKKREREVGR